MKHTTGPRRGRPRGNGKRFSQGGGGKNQTFESSGPEVKIRGTAQQVYEKYLSLARDAVSAGDRIAAEGYFQFADHYYRLVSAANGNGQPRGDQNNRIPPPPESAAGQFGTDDGESSTAAEDMADDEGDDEDGMGAREDDHGQPEPYRHQPQRPADEFRPMRPAEPVQRPRFAEVTTDVAPASQAAELAEALARADVEETVDPAPHDESATENGTGTGHRRGERTLGLGGRRTLDRRSQAALPDAPAESSGPAEPDAPAATDVPSAESREGGLFGPKPIRRRVRRATPSKKEPAGAD
ncbi:MAG: DUF4167 domain-containing protein [Rhodospirillales bacterium]|nr:DUF4167 domain-containing protein [Rhodospirillales bacterium]